MIKIYSVGGDADERINSWALSIPSAPTLLYDAVAVQADPLRPVFEPIWKLVSDPVRQVALKAAWTAYLPVDKQMDVSLPPPLPVQANENVRAQTDGFLYATAQIDFGFSHEGDGGEIYAYTAGHPDPRATLEARRGSASVHWYQLEHLLCASVFTPVRANDWYNLAYTPRWGNLPLTIQFQPFPLELGDWVALPINQIQTAQQDGFVVAYIDYGENGGRGFITGSQTVGGTLTDCVASSVHWYYSSDTAIATESFCMPVVKGSEFRVSLTATAGNPNASAFWISLGPSYRLEAPAPYTVGTGNLAQTNGFLIGFVSAQSTPLSIIPDNGEGYLDLQTAQTPDFANATTVARATAQVSHLGDKLIPYNSATAVIAKGSWFRAMFKTASLISGTASPTVHWIGIVPG